MGEQSYFSISTKDRSYLIWLDAYRIWTADKEPLGFDWPPTVTDHGKDTALSGHQACIVQSICSCQGCSYRLWSVKVSKVLAFLDNASWMEFENAVGSHGVRPVDGCDG